MGRIRVVETDERVVARVRYGTPIVVLAALAAVIFLPAAWLHTRTVVDLAISSGILAGAPVVAWVYIVGVLTMTWIAALNPLYLVLYKETVTLTRASLMHERRCGPVRLSRCEIVVQSSDAFRVPEWPPFFSMRSTPAQPLWLGDVELKVGVGVIGRKAWVGLADTLNQFLGHEASEPRAVEPAD